MACEVQRAVTVEEREAIFRLRYEVHVEEMGKVVRHADHARRMIVDPLDTCSDLLYVAQAGQIIGTLRRTYSDTNPDLDGMTEKFGLATFATYRNKRFGISGRFAVAKTMRHSHVALALVREAYRAGRERDLAFDFLLANPTLIPFYEHLGYHRFKENVFDDDVGFLAPMVLLAPDHRHILRTESPFALLTPAFAHDSEITDWFFGTFPKAADFQNCRLMSDDDKWSACRDVLPDFPGSVSLFDGLSPDDLRALVVKGFEHPVGAGDRILAPGNPCRAVFLVLCGRIALQNEQGEEVSMCAGNAFGRDALAVPQIAACTAECREDARLWCMNAEIIAALGRKNPAVTDALLRNLDRSEGIYAQSN